MYYCKTCNKGFEKFQSMAAHTVSHNKDWKANLSKALTKPRIKITRKCKCGENFNVEAVEGGSKTRNKRKCCPKCWHPRVFKKCLNCDNKIKSWQKYCSRECQGEYQYKTYIQKWLTGEVSGNSKSQLSPYIRRYMLEESHYKCSKCGWCEINPKTGKSPLNIEHKDGHSTNSKKSNLEVLCPNCHSLTPTYGALNKGNGRTYRYDWKLRA